MKPIHNDRNSNNIQIKLKRAKKFDNCKLKIFAYCWLFIICLSTGLPFLWMILTSLKPRPEIFYHHLFPKEPTIKNYIDILTRWQFSTWFINSIFVTATITISVLLFCALCGYGLAKYKFRFNSLIFTMILGTIMIPGEMLLIPWFVNAFHLGVSDSLTGVVFPSLMSAFGVFVMRQAFFNIPNELLDAARIDGMSELKIFVTIAMPLVANTLASLAILTAISSWNEYMWPLIILGTVNKYTIQLGTIHAATADYLGSSGPSWDLTMASTTIAALPMLLLIVFLQKFLVKSIVLSGLKG